ncbi:hypothetical protein GA0116948_11019 [Chitinophaga costaii]|uniref:Uncharacterized protein n=1 Tax=Chitinophaga costaii TaxID=1335309 RepID=A0A1C4EUQ0_9BACT|nr:hypothetical protein [Chitinophaga costaii]PUZ21633.1 hypothetical protein DCM91_16510 [Chitinophaga costaii]SCC47369.1 hypothetical protein GA0116948_11019 [Chitinophaga costaii]
MTSRKLIPYYCTILAFIGMYTLTMLMPDYALGLHYKVGWSSTGRIPLHANIFIFGLVGVLLLINLLEMFSTNHDLFILRLLKSLFTILIVYIGSALVFYCLHTHVWNMYYADKEAPARVFLGTALLCCVVSLTTLDIVKTLLLQMVERTRIHQRIPAWLRFEPDIED